MIHGLMVELIDLTAVVAVFFPWVTFTSMEMPDSLIARQRPVLSISPIIRTRTIITVVEVEFIAAVYIVLLQAMS